LEGHQALAPLRQSRTSLLYYLRAADSLSIWSLNPSGALRLLNQRSLFLDSLAALVTTLRRGIGADKARGGMARSGSGADAEQESTTGLRRGVADEERSPAAVEAAARALSAQLLPNGLLREVPAGSELVIVPQGVLGLIPFAALTAPGDSIPLGIRYALRYAPSLRAIGGDDQVSVMGGRELVVGDPAMPRVTGASGATVQLRDLPAARAEGASVAQRFKTTLLTGSAASESVVRVQLPNARVVHLATHGLAFGSEARVRDSYIALAPDSQNDGLLTIGELLDNVRPLSADLVVLSACQTGLGDLKQAEGTVGFQRAFLAKGARSILVSLWSVDDKATALLMDRFYTHWLGPDGRPSISKAEALRQAQNDVRSVKGYESPRYWAAFQLVGAR
jgi:CHAT domain-containing protein